MNRLHIANNPTRSIFPIFFALIFFVTSGVSQPFTAKLISANGESWGQRNHIEKTSKGNDVYIGELDPSTFNTINKPYIKARLAYLSNDKMGSCSIRSIQRTTFEDGSEITNDPSKYYRKTCLSESYDKEWLDWDNEATKTSAININTTYPAIVYAYSVADGDVYDVYFYVSDDSDPLVEGTCKKLFKVGPDEYEGIYEDLSGLAHWYFNDVTDFSQMFSQDGKLKKIGLNGNFSNVSTITSMFENCRSLEEVNIVSTSGDFGTSITDMSKLFQGCESLKSITFMGSFDNVTNISSMFSGCTNLETAKIGTFNKDKLKTANNVFDGCTSIKSFSTDPDSDADVKLISSGFSNVSTFASMFNGCTSLEDVEIKGTFPNLKSTNSMFKGCSALTSAIIEGDDFGNALTDMQSMFFGCTTLPSVSLTGDFSKVQKMTSMFYNCSSLASAILDGNFGEELTSMASMFYGCSSITSATIYDAGEESTAKVRLSGDFSKVTTWASLFQNSSSLIDVDIKTDLENLTNVSNLFNGCTNLKTAKIDGKFDKLTSLNSLFKDKTNLTTAVIKGEFPLVTTLASLFYNCTVISSATVEANFPEVTTIKEMFRNCDAIKTALFNVDGNADAIIKGNFPKLTNMDGTMRDCDKLTTATINLPDAAANVNNFFKSSKLTSATVNNFKSVTTMESMFSSCTNLTNVTLNGDFSNVTTIAELFNSSTAISSVSLNDGNADFSSLSNVYRMVKNWDISKYDIFTSIFSQMKINTIKLPGAQNNNHRVSDANNWSNKTVKTRNQAEYEVNKGYLGTLLPIELSFFTATQDSENILFRWETATETNNDFFTIEQSFDGVSFHEVAQIDGAGTTSVSNSYDYSLPITHKGLLYFRLKQTDYNGEFSYSDVISLMMSANEHVRLYPTVATDYITIEGDYVSVKFCDAQGKINHPERMDGNTYPVSSLPKGMHYAVISMKNGEIITRKFFKN